MWSICIKETDNVGSELGDSGNIAGKPPLQF